MEKTTFSEQAIIDLIETKFIAVHIDNNEDADAIAGFNVRAFPTIIVVEANHAHTISKHVTGYQTATQLLTCLGAEEHQKSYASTGIGGAIKARPQITAALTWWKENIGTAPVEFAWRRTGAQTFPLLHQRPEQWTCENVLGTLGEFSLEAPNSKLSIQPITLGYRRANGLIVLRPEIAIHETQLGFPGDKTRHASGAATPSGFGPTTILTIASTIQAIWEILHPQIDLTLGGTITAKCTLDEVRNELSIDFKDAPGVKIQAWFQFDLKAKKLTFSEENVRIDFEGSKWIKSRDIRVEQ
jgi:hypothetical protein